MKASKKLLIPDQSSKAGSFLHLNSCSQMQPRAATSSRLLTESPREWRLITTLSVLTLTLGAMFVTALLLRDEILDYISDKALKSPLEIEETIVFKRRFTFK